MKNILITEKFKKNKDQIYHAGDINNNNNLITIK